MSAPMLVPAMNSTSMPASSMARITPRCASPRAEPLPRARPTLGRRLLSIVFFVIAVFPFLPFTSVRFTNRLLRYQLAQHIRQDHAVPVVVHLDRRVDAQQQRDLLRAAVLAFDGERHVLLRFKILI